MAKLHPPPKALSPQDIQDQLDTLKGHFTQYRQSTPRSKGTKIPASLRWMALEALDRGIPADKVQSACHVSARQINGWRSQTPSTEMEAVDGAESFIPPRVLSVVTSDPPPRAPFPEWVQGGLRQGGLRLDLHMGPWRLQLALDEQGGLTANGGTTCYP
jgi:hypothetical protein